MIVNGAIVLSPTPEGIKTITTLLPKSRAFEHKGKNLVAIKHSVHATQVLRSLGYTIPPPITSKENYNWPGKFKPRKHQIETAGFLSTNKRCFCLNDTGTGKTSSALWAADFLMNTQTIRKVLILGKLSSLNKVWSDEIFNVLPHRTSVVLVGDAEKRKTLAKTDADFFVVNYDGFAIVAETLAERKDIDLVIIDEADEYKNAQTKRWKILSSFTRNIKWLWLMTATPCSNSPTDAYGLIKLVNPKGLMGGFRYFKETVMHQVGMYKWIPKLDHVQTINRLMQPAIRFAKTDCLDLPPITYTHREAALTKEQEKCYKQMASEMCIESEGNIITATNAAIKLNKLLQVCCGVVYKNDREPLELDSVSRKEVLKEVIEESTAKVIVFVPFKGAIKALKEYLSKRWVVEVIDGEVSRNERNRIIHAFQKEKNPHVLVAHPATVAHGLTLTAASTVVWYAPVFSLNYYEQGCGRINREGQKNDTHIVHLGGTAIEWRIYETLMERRSVQQEILSIYSTVVDKSMHL